MHDVVSEVLKIQSEKYLIKKLFLVGKSNNYFLLFIRRMSANEKKYSQKCFCFFLIFRVLMLVGDFFQKKWFFE